MAIIVRLFALSVVMTFAAAACTLLGNSTYTPSEVGAIAKVALAGPDGNAMGEVTLTQGPQGVLIAADVSGLAEGWHAFHIHTVGSCSPDFSAAGGHFNPEGIGHGILDPGGKHAGDLPNIYAHDSGRAVVNYFSYQITLDEGAEHSIFDADGSSIIVHEKQDSYGADPGAGGRVACGVIQRS